MRSRNQSSTDELTAMLAEHVRALVGSIDPTMVVETDDNYNTNVKDSADKWVLTLTTYSHANYGDGTVLYMNYWWHRERPIHMPEWYHRHHAILELSNPDMMDDLDRMITKDVEESRT